MPDEPTPANAETEGHVLIVDDDDFMAGIFAAKLGKEGFRISLAPNGMTGIRLAKKEMPDVVLLDIMMPDIDGFNVLHELKGNPKTADIPVFMLTSLGQEADVRRALSEGAADFFMKSRTIPSDMVDAVRAAIAAHRKKRK